MTRTRFQTPAQKAESAAISAKLDAAFARGQHDAAALPADEINGFLRAVLGVLGGKLTEEDRVYYRAIRNTLLTRSIEER